MTDRELFEQALKALQSYGAHTPNCDYLMLLTSLPPQRKPCSCGLVAAITDLRERLAQEPNMPEQYVMVGRFMLQPHPKNGYWLTDAGTSEAMQIFQPEMERVIKELWKQF